MQNVDLDFDNVLDVSLRNFDPYVYKLDGDYKIPAIMVNGWSAMLVPFYFDKTENKKEAKKRLNKLAKEYIDMYIEMFVDDSGEKALDSFLEKMKRK